MIKSLYIIGSLRDPGRSHVQHVSSAIRTLGIEAFDDWLSPGPEADDHWREYEKSKGNTYKQALKGYAATHVYEFDKHHIDRTDGAVLVLPCGRSGHLELGYVLGKGKPGFILLDDPERWDVMYQFATGIYDNLDELLEVLSANSS